MELLTETTQCDAFAEATAWWLPMAIMLIPSSVLTCEGIGNGRPVRHRALGMPDVGEVRLDTAVTGHIEHLRCERREAGIEMLRRLHHDQLVARRIQTQGRESVGVKNLGAPRVDYDVNAVGLQPSEVAGAVLGRAEALPAVIGQLLHGDAQVD